MTDTLQSRVARVITGSAHALLGRIEDAAPIAMLEQLARELDTVVDEVRGELGRIAVNRHLIQQQHQRLNQEHGSLDCALSAALNQARDDLAKTAIARQIDVEAQLPILESSLSQLAQEEKSLSGYMDGLMSKRREMASAITDLEFAQCKSASVGAEHGNHCLDANARAIQAAFDRTYRRQTGLDALAPQATADQSAKLRELNGLMLENKIRERLAALKAGR
ncbi:PspA/IM30 family protein [Pantoea sp. 18069]|uniref:PspA/IM30 family protein n=1 Tax=Pantoea sp. 18069 TaxID=2681415 RepID=UPI001359B438|nr:PspA/IM30 family protein [Pantoea sp. 18069]